MASSFVVSGKGFFKSKRFDTESRTLILEWTNKLSEAKPFTAAKANKFVTNCGEQCFVYKPWEEEEVERKYRVQKTKVWGDRNGLEYWMPINHYTKKSDVTFLQTRGEESKELYTFEEATAICNERNKQDADFIYGRITQ